jgi:glycosyltransferase involved in cell wall biosynthesis
MMPCITVGVTARNEERCIAATLRSLIESAVWAEQRGVASYDLVALLDECTDGTEAIVRGFPRVRVVHARGGLIEAQRLLSRSQPFVIYSDADIQVAHSVLADLTSAMQADPALQVAYPRKRPLPPSRRSLMAAALYCYNRVEGFQKARRYFNGRLFAIRDWQAPTLEQLAPRLAALPRDCFYDYHSGLQVDDIWLSRDVLLRHGADAVREIGSAEIGFRPAETFVGMYRTYLRMRREIERLNRLFPESIPVHQQRGYDWEAERRAAWRDRVLWRVFRVALGICKLCYFVERLYFQHLSSTPVRAWKPVIESKVPLPAVFVPQE